MLEDNFVLRCYHFIFDDCYTNAIYSFCYNNYLFGYKNYIYSTKTVQRTGLQLVYIYIYIYIYEPILHNLCVPFIPHMLIGNEFCVFMFFVW